MTAASDQALIEYYHQASIFGFKIMYRDSEGIWDGIRWDGEHPSFFALRETEEGRKLVIEYCLEVLEEAEEKIRGKATLARLQTALKLQYAEQCENKVFQYQWAMRHPIVKEAITRALSNRFPQRS